MSLLEMLASILGSAIESLCVSLAIMFIIQHLDKHDTYYKKLPRFIPMWLTIFGVSLINYCIHILLPNLKWLKPIIFVPIVSLGIFKTFKVRLYKSLIISILCLGTSAIIELLLILALTSLDITVSNIALNTYYSILFGSIISIIELIIYYSVFKFSKSLATVQNKLKYFVPQLIAIVICMFPTMVLLMINDFKYSAAFIIINLLQLTVVVLVGLLNLKFVVKHENTELELANTIIHNETLSKVNEGVRGFKHDMGNIVQAILGYIAINDSEGAKKYCQNLVIGFNDINILSILSPKVIDEPAIYGVVVNKILIARDKNMTLSLDINTSVSNINFPKFELSRILGILLDNAIEAGEQTEQKKLTLTMYHDYTRNVDVITISNSINNIVIDIDQIFTKNYSTKENPSGFGLYEVNKFLKRNPQSYIVTSIDKDAKMFTQTLTIDSNITLVKSDETLKESTVA